MRLLPAARFTAVLVLGLVTRVVSAQVFSVLPGEPARAGNGSVPGPRPTSGAVVSVDGAALGALLARAPDERPDELLADYGMVLFLPGPLGEMVPCVVARSPVMEPGLAAQHPQIQTFIVQSADGTATGRLEVAPRGLTAMLRCPQGAWMIDPWQSADPSHAVSYWLRDLPGGGDWVCETTEGVHGFGSPPLGDDQEVFGPRAFQTRRTVRLAIACTGEYGVHQSQIQGHAPNGADPLAAIVTVVARANVVYELDMAIHFNLVANNNLIIYFNPATDPYPDTCDGTGGADCSGNLLSPNISNITSVIGDANYDIGHLMTRVYGGVAYLSSVCSGNKAGGISGIPRGGDIDPFSALVVIHEMGHQFGANHTFSGTRGRCQGNVHLSTAWEAGSGSSPMAYAGGCPVGNAPPTDNVAIFADPYFHHGSVTEMQFFLTSVSCPSQNATTNNIPVINSTTGSVPIPPGTAFTLSAAASDADGETLTYSWEQYDSGTARPLDGTDDGTGSLFRAFPPVLSSQRTFPRMADVLAGVPTPGEMMPVVTGVTRRFRVIVRDNHAGAGAVAISPFVNLTIQSGTSPFAVTAPAQGAVLQGGSNLVTWSVGGTSAAPISCTGVTIRLSTDDGATFPQVLGTFANSGSATVTLPANFSTTPAARVRVDAVGKIFFAVSRPFVLEGTCRADYNGDGFLDGIDYDQFNNDFESGNIRADYNHDGFVDGIDYDQFNNDFEAGC